MSTAEDTPDERLRAYGQLFERALLRRERRADALVFVLRADPETRRAVEDLARREAACCPFLDHRIETHADEVIWTISNPVRGDERPAVDATLDAFHALPDHAGSDFAGLLDRLAEAGVHVAESPETSERFELRVAWPRA
jgi:hypothetical protein